MSKHASGYPLVNLFADLIVDTVREIVLEGNGFYKKVTSRVGKRTAEATIADFRTSPRPRVGVAVDTGIKPLAIVTFMRDVKSPGYCEQMKDWDTRDTDDAYSIKWPHSDYVLKRNLICHV